MFIFSDSQKRWWEFLWTMTERELKSKYKLSILGIFWIIFSPIIQMVIIGFIFKFFTPLKTENYLFYLFSGLIIWNFFSSSVTRSTLAIISERFLLKKAAFPKETIILSIVLSNLIQLLISIILLMPVIIFIGIKINFLTLLLLPLCLILFLLFTSGCCLFFSALNVKFRDTNFAVNFLISVWFYLTPIIYTLGMLPKNISSWLYLNPLTGLLEFFRWCLFGWPIINPNLVISNIIMVLIIFLGAFYFFKKKSLEFDDWI